MNRVLIHILPLWFVLAITAPALAQQDPKLEEEALAVDQPVASPSDAEPLPDEAAQLSGQCLVLQAELRRLQRDLEGAIQPASDRLNAVTAALQIMGRPRRADGVELRTLREQAREIQERIAYNQAVLRGEQRPVEHAVTRREIEDQLLELQSKQRRVLLLLQAYDLEDPWQRQRLEATLSFQKIDLEQELQVLRDPFRAKIDRLRTQAGVLGEQIESVFVAFGRSEAVGPIQTEAFRLSSRFEHGLISYSWMDRRGQLVATADLNLRPAPEANPAPPLLGQRFPILQHDNQQVIASVGYFEVRFRVNAQALMSNQRVLEAAQRLLDLEALGRLVPQVGSQGVN